MPDDKPTTKAQAAKRQADDAAGPPGTQPGVQGHPTAQAPVAAQNVDEARAALAEAAGEIEVKANANVLGLSAGSTGYVADTPDVRELAAQDPPLVEIVEHKRSRAKAKDDD